MTMDLLRLIDLIHSAAGDLQAWPRALTAIAEALRARATSLTIVDPESSAMSVVYAPRSDPEWVRAYKERWAASNVVRDRGYALPLGELYDFESLGMPRSEFDRTPFYNEFLAPQHQNFGLIMLAAKTETVASAIGFYRSSTDGRFDPDEERLLRALGPHLQRAVALNLRLAQSQMQLSVSVDLLNRIDQAALLVDPQARVLFANCAAEAVLSEGDVLRLTRGCLTTRVPAETAALHAMIALGMNGAATSKLALSCRDARRVMVEVVPLQAETWRLPQRLAAFVFIDALTTHALPSPTQIGRRLGVTRAQAALAHELLHGDGIPAAAERLGVSRSTARTHLLKLFQKTGTNRQAELVRLILEH